MKQQRYIGFILGVWMLGSVFSGGCGNSAGSGDQKVPPRKAVASSVADSPVAHGYLKRNRSYLLTFEGTVQKVSAVPKIEDMSYDDLIATLKVKVDKVLLGTTDAPALVVEIPVVRNRRALPSAAIAVGDKIRFSTIPWDKVVESVKTIEQVDSVMDYNSPMVFSLAFARLGKGASADGSEIATRRKEAIEQTQTEIRNELQKYGKGSWETWRASLTPFYTDIRDRAGKLPENRFGAHGLVVESTLPVEIVGEPSDTNPGIEQIIALERALRAQGIDFIYVSIPRPWMLYPEDVSDVPPAASYVTPNYRQNLLSLVDADVEVVDLLPLLLAQKGSSPEKFYTPDSVDLHPPMHAMSIIADEVAKRLSRYGYNTNGFEFFQFQPVPAKTRDQKDVSQVISADGVRYADNPESPILVMGDSTIRLNYPAPAVGFSGLLAASLGVRPALMQRDGFCLGDLAKESASLLKGRQVVVWVAWSLCLNKIRAPKCWEHDVDWKKSRVFAKQK